MHKVKQTFTYVYLSELYHLDLNELRFCDIIFSKGSLILEGELMGGSTKHLLEGGGAGGEGGMKKTLAVLLMAVLLISSCTH